MQNDCRRAGSVGEVRPDTLHNIEDDLDEARLLVTAAYTAAADVPREEAGPLRTLLALIEKQLEDLSDRLTAARGAPQGERVER
jgi:hypothetical protein